MNACSTRVSACALVSLLTAAPAHAAGQYNITDLGTLGGTGSVARAINARGQVVGWASTTGDAAQHAFLYSGGVMQDLGTLGGTNGCAWGINASGQVVGQANTAGDAAEHAFLYGGGVMQDLGTLGGANSYGWGINSGGQVVGDAQKTGELTRAAFVCSAGVMQDLDTFGGSRSGAALINDSGQVVGYAYTTGNAASHAFLYSSGTMIDLNSLLPANSGWTLTEARAINDSGQIVGYGTNPMGQTHAFLLTPRARAGDAESAGAERVSARGREEIGRVSLMQAEGHQQKTCIDSACTLQCQLNRNPRASASICGSSTHHLKMAP